MTTPIDLDDTPVPATSYPALWLAVVLLLLTGVVSAVRVDPKDAVGLSTIAASASSAEQAKTFAMEMTMESEAAGQKTGFRMAMRVDNVAQRGDFTMSAEGLPFPRFDGVFGDGKFLVQVPEAARAQTDGKPWVGARVPGKLADDVSNPAASGTQLLEYLAGADGEVTTLGRDDVRGVDTTHYRVGINLAKLAEQGRRQQAAMGFVAPPEADGSQMDASPADVWLDDEGRLRRFRLELTVSTGGQEFKMSVQTELFDFDKPVVVEVPAADQIHPVATVGEATRLIFGLGIPSS